MRTRGPRKFTYTYDDIAALLGWTREQVMRTARAGTFDPARLHDVDDARQVREHRHDEADEPSLRKESAVGLLTAALYNEIEPYAAEWIESLARDGHIADGIVDRRSIVDLRVSDLATARQCHFFAGIGAWSYALRLAGWPDDVEAWTGSCPCQPFSSAGRRGGFNDDRHLWPEWFKLIRERRPAVVFGEQVASTAGLGWIDAVQADLEGAGYAVGTADLCAASVGAPHRRQRLYFVAIADPDGRAVVRSARLHADGQPRHDASRRGTPCGLADSTGIGQQRSGLEEPVRGHGVEHAGVAGFWAGAEWIPCTDGKARAAEPGTFPLAHGSPARLGRLRGYGNAIVPQVAATFVRSVMEAMT